MNEKLFNLSSSPHIRGSLTTGNVMLDVVLALLPATAFGIYRYGVHAFLVIAVSIFSAVITEFVFDYIAKKPHTVTDGSAEVTGLLLGLSLPPAVPLYIPYLGGLFAILFVKCFFGGLGKNFMNPALTARCFLLISFGSLMTDFAVDGVSGATPLAALKAGEVINISDMYPGTYRRGDQHLRYVPGFQRQCHRRIRSGSAGRRTAFVAVRRHHHGDSAVLYCGFHRVYGHLRRPGL